MPESKNQLHQNRRRGFRYRRGATIVLMALVLPVVVVLAAFAINLSYMEMNRTELYIAVDAAARAGGRDFALSGDEDSAKAAARDAASRNLVAGVPLQLADSDFVFGESQRSGVNSRYIFTPGGANPNAVQITGRRSTGSLDGPIPLLMPNLFGISAFEAELMSESTQIEVDVALVLDRSGSMAYADDEPAVYPPVPAAAPPGWFFCDPAPDPSRWRDAVQAVNVFLNELSNSPASELVALCTYNSTGTIDQPLTSNYGSIMTAMDVYTQSFCSGYTDIGGGINEVLWHHINDELQRTFLLLFFRCLPFQLDFGGVFLLELFPFLYRKRFARLKHIDQKEPRGNSNYR